MLSKSISTALLATALMGTSLAAQADAVKIGFVTTLTSEFDFSINGVAVITDRQTEFVGNTADQLTLNTRVEIEGTLDADGNLQAQRVLFLVSDLIGLSRFDSLSGTTETFSWTENTILDSEIRIDLF